MKVPPLIINLKTIEKDGKHEKHHKKHKKHKKHHKKHSHHHHRHDHHDHQPDQQHQKPLLLNPPLLEPVELPERDSPPHQYYYHHQASAVALASDPLPQAHPVINSTPLEPVGLPQKEAPIINQEPPPPPLPATEPKLESDTLPEKDVTATQNNEEPMTIDEPSIAEPDTLPKEDAACSVPPPPCPVPKKDSRLAHLGISEDGGVKMTIIGPMKKPEEGNERVLNLEQICGQLQDGLDVIPSDINEEDMKEQFQVNPVEFVEPPAFGSYLPIKDSTFANLTKEDSEALLDIYGGNPTCFDYAESLQNYAEGTNYLMKMVDSLLDLLTEGKHNKEAVPIRQKLEEAKKKEATPTVQETKAVEDNGTKDNNQDEVQKQLNEIDALLEELRRVQERRLSASAAPIEPDEDESKLADNILAKMTKLIKERAKPGEICDSSSIFKALGIPLDLLASIESKS